MRKMIGTAIIVCVVGLFVTAFVASVYHNPGIVTANYAATTDYKTPEQLCTSLRYLPQFILDEDIAAACRGVRENDTAYAERKAEFWRHWDELTEKAEAR